MTEDYEYEPLTLPIAQEGEDFDIEYGVQFTEPGDGYPLSEDVDHGEPRGVVHKVARRLVARSPLTVPGDPSSRGWGTPGEHVRQECAKVTVRGVSVWVHREVAVIFANLMTDLDDYLRANGSSLSDGADDWGLAIRFIRGTTRWSNHAWGLAIDVNSLKNPMVRQLITQFNSVWVANLLRGKYRSLIRWGGTYSKTKDPMHFEFMGTVQEARALTAALRASVKPKPNPNHQHATAVIYVNDVGHPGAVKDLQGHLNAAYRPYHRTISPLPTDGRYGDGTLARYNDWRRRTGLPPIAEGKVDVPAWTRLHQVTGSVRLDASGQKF